jgi:hypothetical protein
MSKVLVRALPLLAALASTAPASANDFSALFDTNFAYTRVPAVTPQGLPTLDTDQYTFKLAGLYTFKNPGFGIQLEGQDDFHYGIKYNLAHLWNAGGSVFWRDNKGTIGLSASYFSVDAPAKPFFPGKVSVQSYGAFGEYYVFDDLTLQIKGGGTTGGVGLASVYGGGGLTWYDSPDLAVHLSATFTSYTSANNWTNVNGVVEYLPFRSVPVSMYLGYDFVNMSGLGYTKASTFIGGFKIHFGEGRRLVDYERTGPLQWTGNSNPGANIKY